MDLRQKRADIIQQADALLKAAEAQNRDLTPEEATRYGALLDEARNLAARIARADEQDRLNQEITKSQHDPIRPDPAAGARGTGVQVTGDRADAPFRSLGEQLQAVVRAARTPHQPDPRLLRLNDRIAAEIRATGMSEDVPADGGFFVQEDFGTALMARIYNTGAIASRCTRIPITSASNRIALPMLRETSRANGSRWGGVQAYWSGEAGTITASQMGTEQWRLELDKLTALIYATDELLEDAAALEAWINRAGVSEMAFKLDDAILNGTGVGQAFGILTSAALVEVAKEAGQAATTIVAANVNKAYSRCFAPNRQRAVWLINQDTEPQLEALSVNVGTGGLPVYLPPGGLADTPNSRLKGRPVIPVEQCATLGTVGDIILADLSEYILIEKGGVRAAASIHVQFLTAQTAFRYGMRINGRPWWTSTMQPFKGSNTLSPFVAVATRA